MKFTIRIISLLLALTLYGGGLTAQSLENFITADGFRLMDGDRELRFVSWNIPTLNYVEDEMSFTNPNPYGLPNEFEMRDAFESVKRMGGQVIRIYTIPVRNRNFPKDAPTYVESPGEFNEEAFITTDRMLALANEYEIRIIFSLLNNWQWMGGAPNYAEFRDKTFNDFWTDKQLIKDFKKTIKFTLNRTNTITGIKYKEDKAILCWETGNELQAPYTWTREIAAYIKKLDKNHLVLDGYFATGNNYVMEEAINDTNIDMVSSHHYETNPTTMRANIRKNAELVDGRKPYFVGEFGFISTSAAKLVLEDVVADERISGALTWSLRYHHRNGGFYHHSEPLGLGLFKSYHYPGFQSGESYDEAAFLAMYRHKAFEIQNLSTPPHRKPEAPRLLDITSPQDIRWQGSAGARSYVVERSLDNSNNWQVIADNISDAKNQVFANFHDKTAVPGKDYYYRLSAINQAGQSDYSNVVGPVAYEHRVLADNMINSGIAYTMKYAIPVTGDDRSYKEIRHRFETKENSEIVYYSPGNPQKIFVYVFEEGRDQNDMVIEQSADGLTWTKIDFKINEYAFSERNYDYSIPKIYSVDKFSSPGAFIKLKFAGKCQVARVELHHK